MNIKQSLNTIDEILTSRIGHLLGYCPTSDEIENDEVKRLANRLKAASYKETLTNILEWQQRNITFWTERNIIPTLLLYVSVAFIVIGSLTFFLPAIVFLITQNTQLLWLLQGMWIWLTTFVITIATTLIITIWIIRSQRKIPLWQNLNNIFEPSLPMNALLENKLGVCRDYAKLTACLLQNIYPNQEIYFAQAPYHVATGMKIGDELYMLDQRLPILTKNRWNDYRKPKKPDRIERFDTIKKTTLKATFMQKKDKPELNTEELSKRMTDLLIRKQPDVKTISLEIQIPWKNGAILYEENEMTDYSLARNLVTKISSELVRINQITRIMTSRYKNDLIFQIHVTKDKQ